MAEPVAAHNVRPSGMASYVKTQSPFRGLLWSSALAVIARRNDPPTAASRSVVGRRSDDTPGPGVRIDCCSAAMRLS